MIHETKTERRNQNAEVRPSIFNFPNFSLLLIPMKDDPSNLSMLDLFRLEAENQTALL
jgi:hypothetical protein